jgi:hypothetical protein
MNNFFLLNESIERVDLPTLKIHFKEFILMKSENDELDSFYKHDSIYSLNVLEKIYSHHSQENQLISIFIEQLQLHDVYLFPLEIFDTNFPEMCNGYLGIDFSRIDISSDYQIIDLDDFNKFKNDCLFRVTTDNFWERRELLFPKITLCEEVEEQIKRMGSSKYFGQVVYKLQEFSRAVGFWNDGSFSYKQINNTYSLNISPESEQTIQKYGNERKFSLPDGRKEFFELHIKTGDLRFHFFPDDNTHTVYVGYIGPHLRTVTN